MIDEAAPPPPPPVAGTEPAPAIKPLSCPNCGGTIEMRAAGYTVTVVCQYCSSVLDVANPDVTIIERYEQKTRSLDIPLGTRGTLKGVEWEAIGYLRRSEGGSYPWDEYLLFNPYHGYRWLVTDGRGWTLGTMLTADPEYQADRMIVEGQSYKPFFRAGNARVDYVLGEFYWRVKKGESVRTADYVRPGFMLSFEGNDDERSWTLGELIDGKEMAAAFGVDVPRPWSPGGKPPLPHQPSPYGRSAKAVAKLAVFASIALFVLLTMFGCTTNKQSYDALIHTDATTASAKIGPITLTRPYQAVTIEASAPGLDNAWIDLDYSLINRKTQESYDAYGIAERYSGRDSDGDWTEGSRGATTKLAMVPGGEYDLLVDASGQKWGYSPTNSVTLTVKVAQGGRFWSNFFIALILLWIPAIWMVWRHLRFESARQGESDDAVAAAEAAEDDDDE